MVECKICHVEFESEKSLHGHLKAHKMRMVEYYQTHEPRRDLQTNELIKFKNKDYYFSNDFNDRSSMKEWLKNQTEENRKKYLKKFLSQRKEKHDLRYAPCQVELRSIVSPPASYFHKLFGDYYSICRDLGLESKYTYPIEKLKSEEKSGFVIYIDSREQLPLDIDYPVELKGLKFGDYALSDPTSKCRIERKSARDLFGTMSGGFDRFCKEVERAEADQSDLVVLVDEPLYDCLNFESLYRVSNKIKITPEFIFFNIRKIIQKYANIQFLFVDSRTECSRVMKKIFFSGKEYKKYDLQLMYDLKLL